MAGPGKKLTKRQSKSLVTLLPVSQMPSACDAGISVAVTVMLNGWMTEATVSARECALGSGHGVKPDGQSKTAVWVCGVGDGVKFKRIEVGVGTNDAETACAEPMVTEQVVVPEQLPPHPPKVVESPMVAVRLTIEPML